MCGHYIRAYGNTWFQYEGLYKDEPQNQCECHIRRTMISKSRAHETSDCLFNGCVGAWVEFVWSLGWVSVCVSWGVYLTNSCLYRCIIKVTDKPCI